MLDIRTIGRFRPAGLAQPDAVMQHKDKAAELRAKNRELDQRAVELQQLIDALSFRIVEDNDVVAEAEASQLEAEKAQIETLKRRNENTAREHGRLAAEAEDAAHQRNRVALYAKIRSESGTRNKCADRAAKALEEFAAEVAAIAESNARLAVMVPGDQSKVGMMTTKDSFMFAVQHALLLAGRKVGFAMPGGRYSNDQFTDLASAIREAHSVTAERFSDAAARGVRPVTTPEAFEPVRDEPAPEPPPAKPLTDEEIRLNELHGNPLGLPLSGAAWNDLSEKPSPVAPGVDFDPTEI